MRIVVIDRAIETANLVLKYSEQSKLKLEQRKDLRELNFGILKVKNLKICGMWLEKQAFHHQKNS